MRAGIIASSRRLAAPPSGGGGSTPVYRGVHPGSSSTSNTFTVDVGPAHPDRVLVLATGFFASSDRNIDITVNGTPITEVIEYGGALNNRHNIAVGHIALPAGSTAEVSVTLSATAQPTLWAWTVEGALTATASGGTYAPQAPSRPTTVPAGGFAVAVATASGTASWVWTGATPDDTGEHSAAIAATTGTITADGGPSVSTVGLVTVAYQVS